MIIYCLSIGNIILDVYYNIYYIFHILIASRNVNFVTSCLRIFKRKSFNLTKGTIYKEDFKFNIIEFGML